MKIGMDELGYMNLLEKTTKAHVKDCIINDDEIIVVVKEGHMGLAIGRNGENIEHVRRIIGKKISVVEYSDDIARFLKNLFAPAKIERIVVEGGIARIKTKDGRRIIGRKGKRIKKAKQLVERHYAIKDILIEQ